MPTVQLYDNNHSGLTADITFSAITGGSSSLGTQTIPYVFVSDMPYGTYSLYYSQWGQTCTTIISGETLNITVDTNINSNISLVFGANNVNKIFTLLIDWGDGTPLETFSNTYSYFTSHSYTVTPGLYTIKVLCTINEYVNNVTFAGGVTEINNLGVFNNLNYLELGYNSLTTLDISNNTLINYLGINNNQLDVNSVNNILISLSGENISNGYVNTSSQTPSACPTGLGNDAKNYLKYSLFWNITTDICLTEYVELNVTINSPNYVVFYISGPSNFNMVIDWGDGSPLDYSNQGSNSYNPFYPYSTQPLPIKIYFDFPLSVNSFSFETAYGPVLNGVNNLSLLSNLNSLDFNTQLLSSIDLTGLNLLTNVYLQTNYLPTNVVNNVLETLSGNSISIGQLYLNNQTPPACPTGNGIQAQNYLVDTKAWNVQVDTGCPVPEVFRFSVNSIGGSFNGIDFSSTSDFTATVNWGDGVTETITSSGNNYRFEHTYVGTQVFSGTISFDNINLINELVLGWSDGYSNNINSVDVSELTQLTRLSTEYCIELTELNISNNLNLNYLNCRAGVLDGNQLNNILINLSNAGLNNGHAMLTNQNPTACLNAYGIAAQNYLVNDLGWNVEVDTGCDLKITFEPDSVYLTQFSFQNPLGVTPPNYTMTVDWGDGQTSGYSGNNAYLLQHTYSTPGTYVATFQTDNNYDSIFVLQFEYVAYSQNITKMENLNSLNNLIYIGGNNNKISDINNILPIPNTLENIRFDNNLLTSFNPILPLPNSITTVQLFNNQITSFDVSVLPSGVVSLYLGGNQLTSFDGTNLPTGLINLVLGVNYLTDVTIPELTSLQGLTIDNNQLTTFNLPTLPSLLGLDLSFNQIELLSLDLGANINNIFVNDNNLVEFRLFTFDTPIFPFNISAQNNSLPSTEIENTIIDLNDNLLPVDLGGGYMDISNQTGCLPNPSSGYDAYQDLVNNKNFTVNVDICP